ncbi:MAG TPA: folate-binding protein [Alphaproteobacteria bacterium]|jgi:folate-binding protein YgfZ
MADAFLLWPEERGLIRIEGADARAFLQGIVSNDVNRVSPARAIYAALLTPQGKYLHDFFIAEVDGALMLDCEAARRDDLLHRLARYKLRSKVTLVPAPDTHAVALIYGTGALAALGLGKERGAAKPVARGIVYADPRLIEIGARAILPRAEAGAALAAAGIAPGSRAEYERLRLELGLPDGSRDLEIEKSTLLESGFDELAGVDWDKGCYMGQELTARTHYRALIKKRLVPVRIEGPMPPPGTPIVAGGAEVGTMRSGSHGAGLALLKIEALSGIPELLAGEARIVPHKPFWLKIST